MKTIAVFFPAGQVFLDQEQRQERHFNMKEQGYSCTFLEPQIPPEVPSSISTVLDRAFYLSHALTKRSYDILWSARGGYGSTAMLPYLKTLLPPVLPPKSIIGFSDTSFIGNILTLQYPQIRYIHGMNFYQKNMFEEKNRILFDIIEKRVEKYSFSYEKMWKGKDLDGYCFPCNLSLLESMLSCENFDLPEKTILFIEDIEEYAYRLFRKIDSIINHSCFSKIIGVVLGSIEPLCQNEKLSLDEIISHMAQKIKKPFFYCPLFGHQENCLPLVSLSHTKISIHDQKITLNSQRSQISFSCSCFHSSLKKNIQKVHFTGIGGVGMASVAGLFLRSGYQVSGSDGPIYPPMDKVIRDLNLFPFVGYQASNIHQAEPEAIVFANAISRQNAQLQSNEELEEILKENIPTYSFPGALRHLIFQNPHNIVVTGTHGKTTTTSLCALVAQECGWNPSLFVGGAPQNFGQGFLLQDRSFFILEGDEYDSALFDKGPKFFHYEPSVTLINNIEFDHADIYPNLQAIEDEFERLIERTYQRDGVVVANTDWSSVKKVCEHKKIISFGKKGLWKLVSWEIKPEGTIVTFQTPWHTEEKLLIKLFGEFNAYNALGALASLHAWYQLKLNDFKKIEDLSYILKPLEESLWQKILLSFEKYLGVKRRFEYLGNKNGITFFDDFAHHPTAITQTLTMVRAYMHSCGLQGRLVALFEPKNASLRRRVFEESLASSLQEADIIIFGQIPEDKRLSQEEAFSFERVKGYSLKPLLQFQEHSSLCEYLKQELRPQDLCIFLGPSGVFNHVPQKLFQLLGEHL